MTSQGLALCTSLHLCCMNDHKNSSLTERETKLAMFWVWFTTWVTGLNLCRKKIKLVRKPFFWKDANPNRTFLFLNSCISTHRVHR